MTCDSLALDACGCCRGAALEACMIRLSADLCVAERFVPQWPTADELIPDTATVVDEFYAALAQAARQHAAPILTGEDLMLDKAKSLSESMPWLLSSFKLSNSPGSASLRDSTLEHFFNQLAKSCELQPLPPSQPAIFVDSTGTEDSTPTSSQSSAQSSPPASPPYSSCSPPPTGASTPAASETGLAAEAPADWSSKVAGIYLPLGTRELTPRCPTKSPFDCRSRRNDLGVSSSGISKATKPTRQVPLDHITVRAISPSRSAGTSVCGDASQGSLLDTSTGAQYGRVDDSLSKWASPSPFAVPFIMKVPALPKGLPEAGQPAQIVAVRDYTATTLLQANPKRIVSGRTQIKPY